MRRRLSPNTSVCLCLLVSSRLCVHVASVNQAYDMWICSLTAEEFITDSAGEGTNHGQARLADVELRPTQVPLHALHSRLIHFSPHQALSKLIKGSRETLKHWRVQMSFSHFSAPLTHFHPPNVLHSKHSEAYRMHKCKCFIYHVTRRWQISKILHLICSKHMQIWYELIFSNIKYKYCFTKYNYEKRDVLLFH